ncbi:hypothetical protein ZOSMA_46G00580 [Zostera marina]|uniref:Uncharacterized protein n=1 Tax=Zostera marina TaxID=29655 RepID=A0A0K9P069_ZOSMR|nr:hypothetical protein ZOSMA_46G00580 [Zostera marina]
MHGFFLFQNSRWHACTQNRCLFMHVAPMCQPAPASSTATENLRSQFKPGITLSTTIQPAD